MAAFSGTASNIRLDVCQVSIGGTDIGFTEGGVDIGIDCQQIVITSDQYGATPLNTKNTGSVVTVKFVLKETSYANLAKCLYESTLRTTGGSAVGVGGLLAGAVDGLTVAVALLLHPVDIANGTLTNDVNVWKAVPRPGWKTKLGPNKETLFEVEFLALRDSSKTAGKQLIDLGATAAT